MHITLHRAKRELKLHGSTVERGQRLRPAHLHCQVIAADRHSRGAGVARQRRSIGRQDRG